MSELKVFNFELYHGGLSKDVWILIGQRSNVFTKIQIASTCTKLRALFSNHFNLERWRKLKFPDRLYQSLVAGDYELFAFCSRRMGNAKDPTRYYQICLNQASLQNCRDIIDYCISKITESGQIKMDYVYNALECAAKGGHRDLIDYFIRIWDIAEKDMCFGLWGAASGGYKDLCDFFISKDVGGLTIAAFNAEMNGHRNLAKHLTKMIS